MPYANFNEEGKIFSWYSNESYEDLVYFDNEDEMLALREDGAESFIIENGKAVWSPSDEERAVVESKQNAKQREDNLETLLNLIKKETVKSDKLGFNFINTYIGNVLVSSVYVEAESSGDEADGTESKPYTYEIGCELIPNAFYKYNDKLYVYMGTAGTAANFDDETFAEWY